MNNYLATAKNKLNSVELFAGAGGLALGIAKVGFQHKYVVEWETNAYKTLVANQKNRFTELLDWSIEQKDVKLVDYSKIKEKIDLVSGGPPCQPFSLGGKHKGYSDSRDMFPESVRAVRELQPRAFIFENVKGLLRKSFAEYFEYILLQLSYPEITKNENEEWQDHLGRLEEIHTSGHYVGLKYNVVFRLLNAADYGVPQKRERVIIVGFRNDLGIEWSFPSPTHSKEELLRSQWVTGEYWAEHGIPKSDIPPVPNNLKSWVNKAKNEQPLFGSTLRRWQTIRDALKDLPEPTIKNSKSFSQHELQPGARTYPGHTGSYLDEPAKTIKAGDHGVPGGENMLRSHDDNVRYFTVRESARLQTFPDNYMIFGSWSVAMKQLGNAVPVKLAETVASSVYSHLVSKTG